MPWGKYQGVRIRHLPDDYLSWLYDLKWDEQWAWLIEAIKWEMRRRGFKTPELEFELAKKHEARQPGARKLCLEEGK